VSLVAKSMSEATVKRCFKCNSPGHLVSTCPQRATGHSVRSNKCAISNMHVSLESGDQLIERGPGAHVTTVGSQVNTGNASTPVVGCNVAMSLCRSDKAELCPCTLSNCDYYDGAGMSMTAGDDFTDCIDRRACALPTIELAKLKYDIGRITPSSNLGIG